ncbi:MAG: nucleotide exchange factor GrpE [Thermoguttaceae bacterium]|nr:nucleotide exchange factor GrpE [Thermoguttaceae bacterium]
MFFKNKNNEEIYEDLGDNTEDDELEQQTPEVDTSKVEGLEDALKGDEPKDEDVPKDPVKELEKALAEEKERTLRLYAELDNTRRRAAREMVEERKYSGMDVIRAILPVMDNLQRAIDAASQQNADDPLLEGVKMIYQQLTDALKQNNCTRIEALNQPFDPKFHQAISQMPSADVPENTCIVVAQEGYMLFDRVVRASQVVVSKKP